MPRRPGRLGHGGILLLILMMGQLSLTDKVHGWPWSHKRQEAEVPFADAPEGLRAPLAQMAEQRWAEAMVGFWTFLSDKEGHEEGYARAEYELARCALALGLKQIATEYDADLVRSSMDPHYALMALEDLEKITHEEAFDEETIIEELLYEKEFGTLPEELNDFVRYYQALMDFRNQYPRWATRHLEKIQGRGPYYYRGKILAALWALKEDDVEQCRALLEEVVAAEEEAGREVANEAKKALARVLYEQGEFKQAYRLYREIEASEATLADVILEEAWAMYRQGDYRKAMGRLVAFSAPSFQRLFKPEQYLLRALIYMHFCHYKAARRSVEDFHERYGDILAGIRHREDLTANPHAKSILEGMPSIERIDRYLHELDREAALLEGLHAPQAFTDHLLPVYRLKEVQVQRRRERAWNKEVERLKRTLFGYEEQVNLVAYESGMDQFKKVKQMYYKGTSPAGEKKAEEHLPKFSSRTYYAFDGEFWTDELDDYTFFIEDYCQTPERWSFDEPAPEEKKP